MSALLWYTHSYFSLIYSMDIQYLKLQIQRRFPPRYCCSETHGELLLGVLVLVVIVFVLSLCGLNCTKQSTV